MSDAIVERQGRAFVCPRCRVEMPDPECSDFCEDVACPCPLMAADWFAEHGDEL